MKIEFHPIGIIHTPYEKEAPFRPDPDAKGDFRIIIREEYRDTLYRLDEFTHIIVLFYFDRSQKTNLFAHPPRLGGEKVGLFASRSPNRINKIGLDIVRIKCIEGLMIRTSPMDILHNTPLLDIKPYISDLDAYPGAGKGHTGTKS
jgi:tRNA (adenine37-N6)-methyltransferase